jgi:4-amino-4-deoxy-L-arabinose transferase-like glycosyltransferase
LGSITTSSTALQSARAEYAIVHLRRWRDDRWSNAPQWLAMVGSLVGVSVIARRLGASSHGQLFGVLVAATIPMGILQASGTQNDYVTTFWLVVLAEAVLAPPSGWRTFQMGAGMGLALLSKAPPFFAPALLLARGLTAGPGPIAFGRLAPILLSWP